MSGESTRIFRYTAAMTEQWRKVIGFGGDYEVSDSGLVRSLKRKRSIIMKYREQTIGYKTVNLSLNGKIYKRYAHRLVLESFVGPCPEGLECRHLDGDPANNRLENLKWGTRVENAADRKRHCKDMGLPVGRPQKLDELTVWLIRNVSSTQTAIADFLGISQVAVSRVRRRETWNHVA